MSDTNEPPRPDGPAGEPESTPPSSQPPPPPPSGGTPPPPPASPYGADQGQAGAYGDAGQGGGYGTPPPAPPYGQPTPSSYSATDAVGFGWRHFTASPATLLIPVLVIGAIAIVVSVLVRVIVVGALTDSDSGLGPVLLAAAIAGGITTIITQVLFAGLYKGGFAVADGRGFSLGQLFDGWSKSQVVIAALIIGALTLVGTALCYLPALLVGYFTQFTIPYIVDKNMSATEALGASARLCANNLGPTILWSLLALLCLIAGSIVCLVGLLVAVPVVLVGLAYTYRRLQGEPVVEPAPRMA
jgi:uncharacterized membrane protein